MQRNLFALFAVFLHLSPFSAASAQSLLPQAAQSGETPAGETPDAAIGTLLEIIRDDTARQELIRRLESLQGEGSAEQQPADSVEAPSLARRVADFTTGTVERVYASAQLIWRDLAGAGSVFTALPEAKRQRMQQNTLPLLGTIATTVVMLWVFTSVFVWILKPDRWVTTRNRILNTVATVGLNLISDALALAVAYASGYVVAIAVFGGGRIAVEQSLYLNAFLIAGVVRIAIRLFVRPDRPDHAILNLSQPVQATVHSRLVLISALLIYGLTVAVPIANLWTTFLFGRSLRLIVVTLGAIFAVLAIRRISRMIAAERQSKTVQTQVTDSSVEYAASDDEAGTAQPLWQRIWPPVAYVYVAVCYIIAIAYPALMADLIGGATVRTVIAGAVVVLALRFLGSPDSVKLSMPAWIRRSLPGFGDRVNSLLPAVIRVVSVFVLIAAAVYILDAWQVIDIDTVFGRDRAVDLSGRLLSAILIITGIMIAWAVMTSWIDHRLTLDMPGRNVTARTRTLLSLFKNAFTVVAVVFGIMMALSQLGIDIAPLLAGAGVIGLAIGFGAQKLVQDIITGVFIQLENAINEGDVVSVAGTTGAVEKLTIRSVGIRDLNGVYHIVPFSAVDTVSNFMKNFGYHVAEIGVGYKEDVSAVKQAMEEAFERLKGTEHGAGIIGTFEMHGVVALADSSVNIRARIKTLPGQQWAIGRAYTEIVKAIFDEKGIEIPFPHRVVFHQYPASAPKDD
jgi:moderate conductance mechanosensitive channel